LRAEKKLVLFFIRNLNVFDR
jgi:hypothetical protein